MLPPRSVAGEESSLSWTGCGVAGGVAATAAAAITSRESAGLTVEWVLVQPKEEREQPR